MEDTPDRWMKEYGKDMQEGRMGSTFQSINLLVWKGRGEKNIMVTSCKMHVKEIGQSSIINIPTPNADYEEGDSCIYVILNMFQIWKYETKYDLTYLQPLIF